MLGINTIHHENFTKELLKNFDNESVDLFLLDPPYGINYKNSKDYNDSFKEVAWSSLEKGCWNSIKNTGNLIIFAGWTHSEHIKNIFFN